MHRIAAASILAWVILGGCSSAPHPASTPSPAASSTPIQGSRRVVTEIAKVEEMGTTIQLTGQVVATEERTVLLTAPLDGVLSKPNVRVGDLVQQDQVLADFNSVYGQTSLQVLDKLESTQASLMQSRTQLANTLTTYAQSQSALGDARAKVAALNSSLTQAEADLSLAEIDLQRKRELCRAGVYARADVEQSENAFTKARSSVESLRQQLAIARRQIPMAQEVVQQADRSVSVAGQGVTLNQYSNARYRAVLSQSRLVGTEIPPELSALKIGESNSAAAAASQSFKIRAPITGVVVEWSATSGQRVANGTQIGKVVELSQVYVDANAYERDLSSLKEGDRIEVKSPSTPGKTFSGRVRYVGRQVNPDTRTLQVRSLIDNPNMALRPNMFVEVSITRPQRAHLVVIPAKGIITLGSEDFVMVEEAPGKYRKQKVTVGERSGQKAEIVGGLKAGEKVVVDGNLLLDVKE